MTVDEIVHSIATLTTDDGGHIASFSFREGGVIGHVHAKLDKSGGASPELWNVLWTVHWRSAQGQEQRETSTDLQSLLTRFGHLDLEKTNSASLDELLKLPEPGFKSEEKG